MGEQVEQAARDLLTAVDALWQVDDRALEHKQGYGRLMMLAARVANEAVKDARR
jgi:hypothetical protein